MRSFSSSRCPLGALGLVALLAVGPGLSGLAAQETDAAQGESVPTYSLAAVVAKVVDGNPLVRAHRLDVQRAQLDVDELEGFWSLPQVTFDSLSGVVPAARGNVISSPDTANDIDNLGPFYNFSVGVAVPLYTFGRLEHGAAAARSVVNARGAQGDKARADLTLRAVQAYWGTLAGEDLVDLMTEMRDTYDDLIEQVEEKLESNDIDPNDASEIKAARYDIVSSFVNARRGYRLVKRSLGDFLEVAPGAEYELREAATPAVGLSIEDLPRLQTIAYRRNPELRALAAAVAALEESMEVERSNRWPLILVGGGFGWARSPNRDAQDNPFVFDEFNYTRLAAAFNVRWDLNFARHNLNYARRRLERDATDARRRALEMKIAIDVHEALERVLAQERLNEAARESRRESRRWLRTAADDFDLGIGEAQPLIKAYRADYRLQAAAIQSEYELNVAAAELALVIGDMNSYLRWVADGQIALD